MLTPAEQKKYLAGGYDEVSDVNIEELQQEDKHMENVNESEVADKKEGDSKVDLSHIKFLVLDEVDRMLGMGLFPDVREIYNYLPKPNKGRVGNMQVCS
jgi:superfamily II DNA/RNA helicase